MIAQITKLIRRHVTNLPQGELTVSLVPPTNSTIPGTIEIGIKGSKASERLKIDIVSAWESHQALRVGIESPLAPIADPVKELTDKDMPALLQKLRTKLAAAVHSDDPKEGYRALANIDSVIAEELRIYRGDVVHSD